MAKKYKLKKIGEAGLTKPIIDKARFSINYQEQLNQAQLKAVSSIEGNYLVIAGAGTGKSFPVLFHIHLNFST